MPLLLRSLATADRFPGRVDVTVATESATLTWLHVPNIDRYWVEVKDHEGLKVNQSVTDGLSLGLVHLTAGSRHSVQVFPVQCARHKHPQRTAFYTKPNRVENLLAGRVTETSVALNWSKPTGGVDFYCIKVGEVETNRSKTEVITVGKLTPGTLYSFTVLSVVNGSIWSDESSITKRTRPGKVSGLKVSAITNRSLVLKWLEPEGQTTGYRVKAMTGRDPVAFNETVTQTEANVTGLPPGTRVGLTVTALADGDALEGDPVTVAIYTGNSGLLD
ncbi:receptor-type tyrosine-protein phosphatase eta-like isoform 1-T1 [Spinachia spinachia]